MSDIFILTASNGAFGVIAMWSVGSPFRSGWFANMVRLCPALYKQRKESFRKIKTFILSLIGMAKWTSKFKEKSSIVRLIIDSTFVLPMIKSRSDLESLHRLSLDHTQVNLTNCLLTFWLPIMEHLIWYVHIASRNE
jgi:hypothetical protein